MNVELSLKRIKWQKSSRSFSLSLSHSHIILLSFTKYPFVFVSTICTLKKRELNEIHSLYWRVAILENILETFLLEIIVCVWVMVVNWKCKDGREREREKTHPHT